MSHLHMESLGENVWTPIYPSIWSIHQFVAQFNQAINKHGRTNLLRLTFSAVIPFANLNMPNCILFVCGPIAPAAFLTPPFSAHFTALSPLFCTATHASLIELNESNKTWRRMEKPFVNSNWLPMWIHPVRLPNPVCHPPPSCVGVASSGALNVCMAAN